MKHIPLVLVLGFALSLCNLSSKLKSGNSNAPGSGSGSADSGGTAAERAEPTAAQTAALSGGQEIKWDPQGMSWPFLLNGHKPQTSRKSLCGVPQVAEVRLH